MSFANAIRAGRAFFEISMRDSAFVRGLNNNRRRLNAFANDVTTIGTRLAAIGTTIAVFAGFGLNTFASFSDQMSIVSAVTSGTAEEFEQLTDTAKELGRATSFSASQVAAGMVELGRMGFDRTQINAAIAGTLDLSRATASELPLAAAIAGAALRQFELDVGDFSHVVDVLSVTTNRSAQGLEDLGEALKPVGPLAAEAGDTLESTAAAAAILANNAVKGSLAGNALARAYKNLSTTKTQKELKALGVDAVDANNNLKPLARVLAELGHAMEGKGNAERLAGFETLFGRGQVAALKLAKSSDDFQKMIVELQHLNGEASTTAVEMDNNLGGFFRRALSMAEGLQIAFAEQLAPAVMALEPAVTAVAGALTTFIETNGELVTSVAFGIVLLTAFGVALITAGFTLSGLSAAVSVLLAPFGLLTGLLSGAIGILAGLMSPMGAVAALLGVLTVGAVTFSDTGRNALNNLKNAFGPLLASALDTFGAMKTALMAGDVQLAAEILWLKLVSIWERGKAGISAAVASMLDTMKGPFLKEFFIIVESVYNAFIWLFEWLGSMFDWIADAAGGVISDVANDISEQVEKNPDVIAADEQLQAALDRLDAIEKEEPPEADDPSEKSAESDAQDELQEAIKDAAAQQAEALLQLDKRRQQEENKPPEVLEFPDLILPQANTFRDELESAEFRSRSNEALDAGSAAGIRAIIAATELTGDEKSRKNLEEIKRTNEDISAYSEIAAEQAKRTNDLMDQTQILRTENIA